ncbi:helix-turn-helix transcriptional regulator [Nostoc ellipsosporum NOK]|jgi:DNA-binding HxlR family transcriptional regulator|nr:helix-turn-helix transcriptional regulator [Nostoc ellipsosporum NOK]
MADNKNSHDDCKKHILAVHDAMDVLNGKWTISIIAVLCFHHQRRFSDILADVKGISNRMLSKELKDMEMHKLVKRTVQDTQPITVLYELTEYGRKLQAVIANLSQWGQEHRKKVMGK